MAIQWQTATSLWLEDEVSGHFELAAQTGSDARQRVLTWRAQQTPGRVAEVAQWLGASLPKDCDCAPVFPPGFAFCPHCGSALQVAAPVTQAKRSMDTHHSLVPYPSLVLVAKKYFIR